MKKTLSFILALVMCLSLCACATSIQDENSSTENAHSNEENKVHSFVGLYKNKHGLPYPDSAYSFFTTGTGHFMGVYRYYKINADGSGEIYCEPQETTSYLTSTEKSMLEDGKDSFSWEEADGYLVITYSDGKSASYEKKGNIFINVLDSEDSFTKVS